MKIQLPFWKLSQERLQCFSIMKQTKYEILITSKRSNLNRIIHLKVLLDLVTETPEGYLQPILSVEQKNVGNIENVFSKMKLTSTPFSTKFDEDEDEESTTNMNDFQLAETDLIECLLRTNIVQRI